VYIDNVGITWQAYIWPAGASGRQPPTRSMDTPSIHPADNFVGPIAVDNPVSRSPVPNRDENQRTIPKLSQTQTPWIHRRVKVINKVDSENGSFSFVHRTPDRPTALRDPPSLHHKWRVVREEEDVTEELRTEFEAWMKVRIVAVKRRPAAKIVWLC
jgi:hypothetical protein